MTKKQEPKKEKTMTKEENRKKVLENIEAAKGKEFDIKKVELSKEYKAHLKEAVLKDLRGY